MLYEVITVNHAWLEFLSHEEEGPFLRTELLAKCQGVSLPGPDGRVWTGGREIAEVVEGLRENWGVHYPAATNKGMRRITSYNVCYTKLLR